MPKDSFHHALKVKPDACIGCTHCVQVCPTQAVRVREGKAVITENRCVDCGECMRVCPVEAIHVEQDDFNAIFNYKHRVALVPAVFLGQFAENIPEQQIYSVLYELGFTHIFEVEQKIEYLTKAINQALLNANLDKPLISTFCPAIVRLIQVKFPSLVDNILKFRPPSDISAKYIRKKLIDSGLESKDTGVFYITPCAAKIAAIKSPVGESQTLVNGVINMDFIYNKVLQNVNKTSKDNCVVPPEKKLSEKGIKWSLTNGEIDNILGHCYAVDEIHNVIEFLEMVENEEITGVDFLELRACDGSCAGGVLTSENRFVTIERMKRRAEKYKYENEKVTENEIEDFNKYNEFMKSNITISDIKPRSMLKLDEDMAKAIEKMQKAKKIETILPKIDCGGCGSPGCSALAEDIVQGKAKISQCVFYQFQMLKNSQLTVYEAYEIFEKIWGTNKFSKTKDK